MVLTFFTLGALWIVLIICLIDVIPIAKDWLGRIHIGRFSDQTAWNRAVAERGGRWLIRTPKMRVTDQTRLLFVDMLRGNYSSKAIQHWQEAALILGLESFLITGDHPRITKKLEAYLERCFLRSGQWKTPPEQIDGAILAYALIRMLRASNRSAEAYKPAWDVVWELIQAHMGADGTVMYRGAMKDYRYVDTIGFICPFLIAYGVLFHKDECVELAIKQIDSFARIGMMNEERLPYHAYKIGSTAPLGLCGWGRGLAWYAIGLGDAWSELPDTHWAKPLLQEKVRQFALTAMKHQQPSGAWNWTVTRNEARADSSATSALAWFLLTASTLDDMQESCTESAERAIHYLMRVTRRDGSIDFSQGDTKDIGVYSGLYNVMPFTQGFAMRAAYCAQLVDTGKEARSLLERKKVRAAI